MSGYIVQRLDKASNKWIDKNDEHSFPFLDEAKEHTYQLASNNEGESYRCIERHGASCITIHRSICIPKKKTKAAPVSDRMSKWIETKK